MNLGTPIEKLPRVGPRFLSRLKKLGIKTVRDLLWHFPVRYEDYSEISPIAEISRAGQRVNVIGRIGSVKLIRSWRRRMAIVTATVSDESGDIRAVWFNQPYILDTLKEGTMVSLAGKVSLDKKGIYLSSPSYEKIGNWKPRTRNFVSVQDWSSTELRSGAGLETENYQSTLVHTGRLVPIYPETEGLTSKYLRFLIKPLLAKIKSLPDPLPAEIVSKYNFPKIADALTSVHFPEKLEQTEAARQRFAFEELMLFQLRALRDHRQLQTLKAPAIKFDKDLVANFVKSLPFELTNDQRIAAYEILQDLERPFPMNRLLNGDVGSGKTVVSLIAAYQAANAGYQVAFMVPTEILARQHFGTITEMLSGKSEIRNQSTQQIECSAEHLPRKCFGLKSETMSNNQNLNVQNVSNFENSNLEFVSNFVLRTSNLPIRVGLLIGNEAKQWPVDKTETEKVTKKLMHEKVATGEIDILIGTHAVIQKDVKFAHLGLVIIDEQHRFGVEQRMKLIKSSNPAPSTYNLVPHLLSMTATPIPRTLALTIYGDLDVSLIKEKPKGRQIIVTKVVPHTKRENAHKFIDEQITEGRQAFVICPRIQPSDTQVNVDHTRKDEDRTQTNTSKSRQTIDFAAYRNPIGVNQRSNQRQSALALWSEVKAVEEEYEKLSKKIFPHRKVAMLHGRMKPKEKEEIMKKFNNGHYSILVSTSVVEVGVDIPNATIMMIESAERFGLAQLHQFRGRVGRGAHQSHCLLFTTSNDVPTTQRLRAMEKTDDGFQLAEADLKLRGPGEFTGIKQSGLPDFAMTSLADLDLIKKARLEARLLLKDDPALTRYPLLAQRLNEVERLVHFE